MTVGNRLKTRLEELGLKQNELAKRLGISPSTLNGYIKDYREPDIKTLERLAKELDTTVEYIATGEPSHKELVIPDELKNVQVAFHRGEFEDLTQDEVDALAVLAKTLREQRKKKEGE